MAQWLARGTAVVGVLVLEWVSYGYGPPPASPPLPAPQTQAGGAAAAPALKNGERSRTFETLAQLPLRFEANAGQFDERIRFAARGVGYGVALTPTGATLNLTSSTGTTSRGGDDRRRTRRRPRRGPPRRRTRAAARRRQPCHRLRPDALAHGRRAVRPRPPGRRLRRHRPRVLRQPAAPRVPTSWSRPAPTPRPSASASTAPSGSTWTAAAICWCTSPAASRCASRRPSAIR